MGTTKRTIKEIVASIIRDGEVISQTLRGERSYIIVKAYGHTYWIDNPYGRNPKITQLENVSKN